MHSKLKNYISNRELFPKSTSIFLQSEKYYFKLTNIFKSTSLYLKSKFIFQTFKNCILNCILKPTYISLILQTCNYISSRQNYISYRKLIFKSVKFYCKSPIMFKIDNFYISNRQNYVLNS